MAEIQIKEVKAMEVMSLPFTGPYEQTQDKLDELMSWLLRAGHPYTQPPMGLYYDDPAKTPPDKLRAEVCLPIEEACEPAENIVRKTLPSVTVASAVHKGPYHLIPRVYEEIFEWIRANGYRYLEGEPTREVFLQIQGQVDDPEEFLTEVQVPVTKA